MVFIDTIEARAYSRATEVVARVQQAVLTLFPEDIRDRIRLQTTRTEGHYQNPITVLSAVLNGSSVCENTLSHLLKLLSSEEAKTILESLDQRLDETCTLFLRIDKQEAYLGRVKLATGPDVINIQYHIRNYPRCTPGDVRQFIGDILGRSED